MKLLLLPLLAVGLTACATRPADNAPQSADAAICERESRVGSNLPATRCRTAEQREAERRKAESIGDGIRPGAATGPGRSS